MNETLILIKPGAPLGWAIDRIERRDFEIIQIKKVLLTRELLDKHYEEHLEKDWYPAMLATLLNRYGYVIHVYGPNAQESLRLAIKNWRQHFGLQFGNNWFHASDSPESADREIELWFPESMH